MNTKIIGEIGINHNGSMETTKKLIDIAVIAGCNYVKFQKRNPDKCVPENEKYKIRSTPWGDMTYIDYKHKIEFDKTAYDEIDTYCKQKNIGWFASVWDIDSVDFMSRYTTTINGITNVIMKIPSALITNKQLIQYARKKSDYLMISTGMSTEEEIESAVVDCSPDLIFHTNSAYPSHVNELNMKYISWLRDKYTNVEVGYSGHEFGLTTTTAAVVLGATWIERHITIDRTDWGSDQMASVEPIGLIKLVKRIRDIEASMGTYGPRIVSESELSKRKSLRGV